MTRNWYLGRSDHDAGSPTKPSYCPMGPVSVLVVTQAVIDAGLVPRIEALILAKAGGFSFSDGVGLWRNGDGKDISEPHRRYTWSNAHWAVLFACAEVCLEAGEACAYVEHEGNGWLVS